MIDVVYLFRVLLLLAVANSTPMFATKLLRQRYAAPFDAGITLPDGRRLFGDSKTIRGIAISIASTTLAAPALGFEWSTGAIVAAVSMTGDLISSFFKRRLGFPIHAEAFGLDQVPEALLPLLVLQSQLTLGWIDITAVVVTFVVFEVILSYLLFKLGIREQPY